MSASGHKRPSKQARVASALPAIADTTTGSVCLGLGPTADLNGLQTLFLERREGRRRCATMASMFRFRIPPTVLLVLIVGGTSSIFVFFGLYILIALIAL